MTDDTKAVEEWLALDEQEFHDRLNSNLLKDLRRYLSADIENGALDSRVAQMLVEEISGAKAWLTKHGANG